MTITETEVEAAAKAVMMEENCGYTLNGERVFCDDPRSGEHREYCHCKASARAALTAAAKVRGDDLRKVIGRLDFRLNNHLCEMKPGYDDSVTGFNKAWDIMHEVFGETIPAPLEKQT